ncbi:MAG: single-stranded DNA-binding protein [Psychrobium sp.]
MNLHDNHIVLLGNIVSKHNQIRYFADGTAMLPLEVITKRKWRDAQGTWQEHSNYFSVTLLGQDAEDAVANAQAGQGIYVRAQIRQLQSQSAQSKDTLQAQQVKLMPKSTAINWNQAHLVGTVVKRSELVQTINGVDLLTLELDVSNIDDKTIHTEVKLKGATAKYIANQLSQDNAPTMALVEGVLSGQSKKVGDSFSHQYWVEGHTCVLS